MRLFSLITLAIFLTGCTAGAAQVSTEQSAGGWRLLVDGRPFFVRGISYSPTAIGEDANDNTRRDWMVVDDDNDGRNDYAYQSWVDANRNNRQDADEPAVGDFKLLKEMGANTIRVYHHSSDDPTLLALNEKGSSVFLNHAPNKELMRALHRDFGIWIAMGDLLGSYTVSTGAAWKDGTDYTDSRQRANMLKSVEVMVNTHKDEPYILFWVLGNENNLRQFTNTNADTEALAYLSLVNEAAEMIKKLDGNHPVAICHGAAQYIELFAEHAPAVDIFGMNMYVYSGFEPMWQKIAHHFERPVLLTEFGTAHPRLKEGELREDIQAKVHRANWEDIEAHAAGGKAPQNAIGGFIFQWADEWWFNGEKWQQNTNPDGSGWHLEYNGMASLGDGSGGSLIRQLREVYFMYKEKWNN
jgi:beta-glucuronidase